MKFFTKLTLLLVVVTILPLIIITALFYTRMRSTIFNQINDQLISLADSKEQEMVQVFVSHFNLLKMISSRTSLRTNLQGYSLNQDKKNQDQIKQILFDASNSVSEIQAISVFDKKGELVASTDPQAELNKKLWPLLKTPLEKEQFQGIFKDVNDIPRLLFTDSLNLDNQVIGFVSVTISIDSIIKVVSNYIGLGLTGEMLLAQKNDSGDALFITPTRFDPKASLNRIVPQNRTDVPIVVALQGQETLLIESNIVDYRNVPVIAVTRYEPITNWGLVIKQDRAEAYQPLQDLFMIFLTIFVLTEVLILLISFFASRWLVRPLILLSRAAKKIAQSNFQEVQIITNWQYKKDEVASLITVFNEMIVKLKESYANLEKKVADRTSDLEKSKDKLEEELTEVERLNNLLSGRELKMIELKKKIEELEKNK